jgi:glycosyltransferase involved in cell wall biosynthesis
LTKIDKKIAIFKPYNARHNNAFGSGQYEIFKRINQYPEYEVTFFLDDKNVHFKGVENKYIKENKIITLMVRIYRKLFRSSFSKIPYYSSLNFDNYDVVITEGIHYSFLKYFYRYNGKLILNDSITSEKKLKKVDSKLVNKVFRGSLSVVVNKKIQTLYEKNHILLRTEVIGHSLQLDKIKFIKRAQFKGKLLSIGRLTEEKGYIYIFSAIKQLVLKYPNLILDVYGEGCLEGYLVNYIKNNNLQDNIFLRGVLEHQKLLKIFYKYDLFVSHPVELDHVAEAFHMGNMEAMSSGMPVITTNCGGVPFVVEDKAIVCNQRSVKEIIESIQLLFDNKMLFNQMSIEGRKYIEANFSHKNIVRKWIKVIDNN